MLKKALKKLSVFVAIYVVVALLFDPLLRWAAEKAGASAAGAKVEIASLKTGLFPPRLELKGVAVADATQPMQNVVEFERLAFALEGRPLLQKKFIVGEAALEGLKLSSPRTSSGAIPSLAKKTVEAAPGITDKLTAQATSFSLAKVGEAKSGIKEKVSFNKDDLESYKLAQSLQAAYAKKGEDWQKKLAAADLEGRSKKVQQAIDAAQAEKDNMKKLKALQGALGDAQKLSSDAKALEASAKQDFGGVDGDLAALQAARQRDTQRLMDKYKLPSLDAESLTAFLLGPDLAAKVQKALYWIRWARSKMPPGEQDPPPPVRGAGVTVPFPVERSYPRFAIRRMTLTGEMPMAGGAAIPVAGEATGITTEQARLGEPLQVHLSSTKSARAFKLDAVLDHRKEPVKDGIDVVYEGAAVEARELGNAASLLVKVSPGTGGMNTHLVATGDALDGKISLTESGVKMQAQTGSQGGGDLVGKLAGSALSGLDRFEAGVTLKGTLDKPELSVSSSLGKALADGLKKALGGEVEAKRKEIQSQIDGAVGAQSGAVKKTAQDQQASVLGKLGISKDLDKKVQSAIAQAQKQVLPGGSVPDLKKLFK